MAKTTAADVEITSAGTPKTCDHRTVQFHVKKARAVINDAFAHKNWQVKQPRTRKQARRVNAHRQCLLAGTGVSRKMINLHRVTKRQSYRQWRQRQINKQDPYLILYLKLSPERRASLAALSVCEGSGSFGEFGWIGWRSIPNLIPLPSPIASSPTAASFEQQAVLTSMVADRYGWGGWPACSRRLGLR